MRPAVEKNRLLCGIYRFVVFSIFCINRRRVPQKCKKLFFSVRPDFLSFQFSHWIFVSGGFTLRNEALFMFSVLTFCVLNCFLFLFARSVYCEAAYKVLLPSKNPTGIKLNNNLKIILPVCFQINFFLFSNERGHWGR